MAEKTIRLNKVAREFNVGVSTLVEYLNNKGHEVDSNPNTKISEEQYKVLSKEFCSDINLKKESKKVDLKSTRAKKEIISIETEKAEEISAKDEAKLESNIRVVGKIDLDTTKQKKPEVKKEVKKEAKKEEEKQKAEIKHEEPKKIEEVKKETPEKKDAEMSISLAPTIKDEVKVVGRIDLDAINQRTRPARKSKAEKEKERKEKETEKRKKPGEGSSSNDAKKKRKRIHKKMRRLI